MAENGLAPVYIMGSPNPLSPSPSSILLLLPCTIDSEYDYGEATLSILVVLYLLLSSLLSSLLLSRWYLIVLRTSKPKPTLRISIDI